MVVIGDRPIEPLSPHQIREIALRSEIDAKTLQAAADELLPWSDDEMQSAIQFLSSTANAIASICYQGYQLQKRVRELSSIREISGMLTSPRGLQEVLDVIVESATKLLNVGGCVINLIDEESQTLNVKASYNLNDECLEIQSAFFENSEFIRQLMAGQTTITEDITQIGCAVSQDCEKPLRPYASLRDSACSSRYDVSAKPSRDAEKSCSMFSIALIAMDKIIGTIHAYCCGPYEFTQDQVALFRAIANQTVLAIEGTRLYEKSLEMHRIEQELSLASQIQFQLLPQQCPKMEGFQIAGTCLFSRYGIGGDFYDLIPISEQHLGIVIADVIGKGIPSAILMSETRAALRAQVNNIHHPDEIIERVNQTLHRDTRPTEFVTMFYARLDTKRKSLRCTNAGHNPPIRVRNGELTLLEKGGPILGFIEDAEYEDERIDLMPGDIVFLYTDGVTEARNPDSQEMFGVEQLHQVVIDNAGLAAQDIIEQVLDAVHKFVKGEPLDDDITMLVLKVD